MYCNFGDEGSIRQTVFTCFGLLYMSWTKLQKWGSFKLSWKTFLRNLHATYSVGRRRTFIRWFLYLAWSTLFVVYIIINVALKDASKLRPIGGMAAYFLLMALFSTNRRRINWHCVFYGTVLQCLFGLFIIKTSAGTTVLLWFSDRFLKLVAYSDVGAEFLFGEKYVDHPLTMKVFPSVIFFFAVINVLSYLGIIKYIVQITGTPLAYLLDISPHEAMMAIANILLGWSEASVLALEYLRTTATSKLFCIFVGAFASCSGSGLILYMAFGKQVNDFYENHKRRMTAGRNLVLLLVYLVYYGYAMYCNFGDEGSIRLTVFTCFGLLYISWTKLQKWGSFKRSWKTFLRNLHATYSVGRRRKFIRWFLYIAWSTLFVVYIIINVALKDASKLRPLGGMAAYLLLMALFSTNRRRINWHCVFYGTVLQCLFGLFVIKTSAGATVLLWISDRLSELLAYSDVGAKFLFGKQYVDHPVAMKVIPSVIFFFAVVNVVTYLGVVKIIVWLIGAPLAYILDISPLEAMMAIANMFLGGTEASVLVLEYLRTTATSKMFCIFVSGSASCSGAALILYMAFGVPLKYLLAASAMSAPAALVCSKLIYPDVEDEIDRNMQEVTCVLSKEKAKISTLTTQCFSKHQTPEAEEQVHDTDSTLHGKLNETKYVEDDAKDNHDQVFPKPANVGEALVLGTKNGIKYVASIAGLMIVSFAVVELLNETVMWFGDRVNVEISLNKILSYLFYPFAYTMGVDREDCLRAGELLGLRTLSSTIISYGHLGEVIHNREIMASYTEFVATFNETFIYDRTKDIFLPHWNKTLLGGVYSERSELIVTYALCGFASITAVGILFGFVTTFVPEKLQEITTTRFALRLLLAGTIASYLTACVAGLLV